MASALLLTGCFHIPGTPQATPPTGAEPTGKKTEGSAKPTQINVTAPAVTGTEKEPVKSDKKESPSVKPAAQVFDIESGNLFFKPSTITVKVNQPVTLNFSNAGFHTFTIDELGVDVNLRGKPTASATFTPAKTGTFSFYCAIPGHAVGGMKGTIVVQ